MPNIDVKWTAPEFEFRPKGVSWYWMSIIVAVVILAAAVWQKNFLFGFFVVIAEILVLVWANNEPRNVEFALNEKGILVGKNKFTAYAELESFSVEDNAEREWPVIFIQFRRKLKPALKIRIPKSSLPEAQKNLAAVLRQDKYEPSLLDALEELIGF